MKKNQNTKHIYDSLAKVYDRHYHLPIHRIENEYVRKRLKQGRYHRGSVLDIGCGTGSALDLLSSANQYSGIDISTEMLNEARRKFPDNKFFHQNMHDIKFPDSSFNNIISLFGSLSYSNDIQSVISEMRRVLKPGGRFFLMVYGKNYPKRENYILNCYKLPSNAHYFNIRRAFKGFSYVKVTGMTLLSDKISKFLPFSVSKCIHRLEISVLGKIMPGRFYFQIITGVKCR